MNYSVGYVFSAVRRVFSAVLRQHLNRNYPYGILKKEVRTLNNRKVFLAKVAKSIAENALKRDANQTTCGIVYQPKAPAGLQRFKKEKK